MLFYIVDNKAMMKRALALAKRAWGRTSPNPMVGAVLLKRGKVIAEAYHKKAGTPHAEALALAEAGEKARGATLYVTLEPCCHTAKRTPPCTNAIIQAGVSRVVAAMLDPNPKVSGKGLSALSAAGLEVAHGLLGEEARRLNEAYIKHVTTGMPFVTLKAAMTLDGKIATPTGQSKWITGERSRALVHRMRNRVDAILTAIGTVKADDPSLTARLRGGRDPIRIVIDPELQVPEGAKVLVCPPRTILVTRSDDDARIVRLLGKAVEVLRYEGGLDMQWLMQELGSRGITSVMVEGGASLNAHALEQGVVDRVMIFIAPKMIGGRESLSVVGGERFRSLEEAYRIEDIQVRRLDKDILIEGRVVKW